MILGSHNAWTFVSPKKWWMKLLRFTARCQKGNIQEQYACGSRFFDLRIKFPDKQFTMAHGCIVYNYSKEDLYADLAWLSQQPEKIYIRVVHEIRHEWEISEKELMSFKVFCIELVHNYPNIVFCNGCNLLPRNGQPEENFVDFRFPYNEPSCEELYASVQPPKLLDDWFPWIYAKLHNHKNIQKGTDKEVLLIDFVNIQ